MLGAEKLETLLPEERGYFACVVRISPTVKRDVGRESVLLNRERRFPPNRSQIRAINLQEHDSFVRVRKRTDSGDAKHVVAKQSSRPSQRLGWRSALVRPSQRHVHWSLTGAPGYDPPQFPRGMR